MARSVPACDGYVSTECESDDDTLNLGSLLPTVPAVQTAYDILGRSLGESPDSLKAVARIRRVKPSAPVYALIELYVSNSHCPTHKFEMEVVRIYKVRRFGEKYHRRGQGLYRMMLWHGTKAGRVANILKSGFALPSTNPGTLMYGTGVYFADRASKSAGYCDGTRVGTTAFMFLCDVSLGKVYKARLAHNEFAAPPPGYNTMKGNGQYTPDWKRNSSYHGSIMPTGPTVQNTRFSQFPVLYNEYVVYEPSQVVMSFLVEIKFTK